MSLSVNDFSVMAVLKPLGDFIGLTSVWTRSRKEMKLALACDDRIYDGVEATRLSGRIVEILAK